MDPDPDSNCSAFLAMPAQTPRALAVIRHPRALYLLLLTPERA